MARFLFFLIALVFSAGAAPELVFSALVEEHWQIHFQQNPQSKPIIIGDISGDHGAPTLSFDKTRLAFEIAGKGAVVCQLTVVKCYPISADNGFFSVRPVWLSGNDQLAMVRYQVSRDREDSRLVMYKMPDGVDKPGKLLPILDQTGNQDYVAATADGRFLAYSSAQLISVHKAATQVTQALWLLDRSTGTVRPLSSGNWQDIHASFSQDGKWLSFASDRSGQFEIYVMNLATGEVRQFTSGTGPKTWPRWTPSDHEISYTWVNQGRYEIWVQPVGSNTKRQLFPFGKALSNQIPIRDGEFR